jgi:putative endonuclease
MASKSALAEKIDRIAIGKATECAAENYLLQKGLVFLHRNFRCRMGEIDLVMRDEDCLVFVEVRFRRQGQHGSGAESITHAKRQKLIRSAAFYLRACRISSHQVCRFDVISIARAQPTGNPDYEFEWIRNAFRADD